MARSEGADRECLRVRDNIQNGLFGGCAIAGGQRHRAISTDYVVEDDCEDATG